MLIDARLPVFHRSAAAELAVRAPGERVYRATHEVTLRDMPSTRRVLLLAGHVVRMRPGFAREGPAPPPSPDERILRILERAGWSRVAAVDDREFVMVSEFPGVPAIHGSVAAFSVHVDQGTHAARLAVELRVFFAPDQRHHAAGMRGVLIPPGFRSIANEWLRAVRRRAEAPQDGGSPTRDRGDA